MIPSTGFSRSWCFAPFSSFRSPLPMMWKMNTKQCSRPREGPVKFVYIFLIISWARPKPGVLVGSWEEDDLAVSHDSSAHMSLPDDISLNCPRTDVSFKPKMILLNLWCHNVFSNGLINKQRLLVGSLSSHQAVFENPKPRILHHHWFLPLLCWALSFSSLFHTHRTTQIINVF